MISRLTVLLSLVAWLAAGAAGHAAAAPAASPEVAAALTDLTGDDADKREAAVAVIGKTRDPKWIQFLRRSARERLRAHAGRQDRALGRRQQGHQGRPGP